LQQEDRRIIWIYCSRL